jgi:hypothetical protein
VCCAVRRNCFALLEGVLTFADLDAAASAALFVTHCDGTALACAVLLLVQQCLLLAACLAVVSSWKVPAASPAGEAARAALFG